MANLPRFYVYQFSDEDGVVYIGKGSGRRINAQFRKFNCAGKVLEYFLSEEAAYEAERRYIAEIKPRLNIHPGGNGSRVKVANRVRRRDFWERNMQKIGSKRYAARLLMECERVKSGTVSPSKLDAIRQVANGCWA